MTNNFQIDKEKFVVALGHCDSRFGTFTVGFDKIPLSSIRLEHLFLLPIRTIMGYLHHHGIGYRSIPCGFKTKQTNRKEDDVLKKKRDCTACASIHRNRIRSLLSVYGTM